jgi:16S rRNA (cytosine1402-N4)-methyltransferase
MGIAHIPVLLEEVMNNLVCVENNLFVDATIGGGGHSYYILERHKDVKIIGIDVDEDALKVAEERLYVFKDRVTLIRGNFRELKKILNMAGIPSVGCVLFDLGLSTYQLMGKRGFSFDDDSFLDMRMDNREKFTAYDVVNGYTYERLIRILEEYGEERKGIKIARAIIEERKQKPISTSKELSNVVLKAKRRKGRLHPATKTFQAVRIEVNGELENVRAGIGDAIDLLSPKGRIGVISFHSLEDRIAKNILKNSPLLKVLTKKTIRPDRAEIKENPRARSAKLRIAEKR